MNRQAALGCSIALLLLAAAIGAGLYYAPKLWRKGLVAANDALVESGRIGKLEADWQPPSAQAEAGWFPQEVGAWKRVSAEASAGIPALNIERAGHRAVYQSASATVEVDVLAANDLEKEALLKRAQDALSSGSGSRMTTTFGHRVHVRVNSDHTRLWWVKGWLFIFRERGTDPENRCTAPDRRTDLQVRPSQDGPGGPSYVTERMFLQAARRCGCDSLDTFASAIRPTAERIVES